MSFLGEIKRRKVFQVAAVYAVVAWLIIQIVGAIGGPLNLPDWLDSVVIVLLAVGFPIAVILAWAFELTPGGLVRDKAGPDRGRVRAVADVQPNSIAVLPFANVSPNSDDAYFAAGLHEEILNQLARLRKLSVTSRTSVLRYANSDQSVPEIASELNVGAVMEGSVRFAGDRIRVTAQLIDAATDRHLWSETYDRDFKDIFAIESDIANRVATALRAELTTEEKERIARWPTHSPEAYTLYLKAIARMDVSMGRGPILQLLDQAIAVDANLAAAHALKAALLSDALVNTVEGAGAESGERLVIERKSREAADRAISLDPMLSSAHGAAANIDFLAWRWTAAEQSFKRARELDTRDDIVTGRLSWLLAYRGRHAEAVDVAQKDFILNPGSWIPCMYLGLTQGYVGAYADAVVTLKRGSELAPILPFHHHWMALMYIALGDNDAASRELGIAERLMGDNRVLAVLTEIAYAYGRIDRAADAQRVFDEIAADAVGGDIGEGTWAMAYLAIGDEDRALQRLEAAAVRAANHEVDQGFYSLMALKKNLSANPVLEQPSFVNVLSRMEGH